MEDTLAEGSPASRGRRESFVMWLAGLLRVRPSWVETLLRDGTATQFLIAWSLFEAKCFGGYCRLPLIRNRARELLASGFDIRPLERSLVHFHTRYQDPEKCRHLFHDQDGAEVDEFRRLLGVPLAQLAENEQLQLLLTVTYRYRNNMFHGNKRIQSWLQYRPEIRHCLLVMQQVVKHSEAIQPSLEMN